MALAARTASMERSGWPLSRSMRFSLRDHVGPVVHLGEEGHLERDHRLVKGRHLERDHRLEKDHHPAMARRPTRDHRLVDV